MENSIITFNGGVYKIIDGTPMGHRHSVTLANCFMSKLLREFLAEHQDIDDQMEFLGRFLDDLFGFWNGTEEQLLKVLDTLNEWCVEKGYKVQFELAGKGAWFEFPGHHDLLGRRGAMADQTAYKGSGRSCIPCAIFMPSQAYCA